MLQVLNVPKVEERGGKGREEEGRGGLALLGYGFKLFSAAISTKE